MLYNVVLTFESWHKILTFDLFKDLKAIRKLLSVAFLRSVFFAVQGVLTFESVDEILNYDQSNKCYDITHR